MLTGLGWGWQYVEQVVGDEDLGLTSLRPRIHIKTLEGVVLGGGTGDHLGLSDQLV